jgi:PIN domain nuclease of toxin-antitoxin system
MFGKMMEKIKTLLLDTHVWVWFANGEELSQATRNEIRDSLFDKSLFVSAISVWEVGMLVSKNRLQLSAPPAIWTNNALNLAGLVLAQLKPDIALESSFLPGTLHADPADRIIIATARALNIPVMTRDQKILDYAQAGHVSAIKA